MKYAPDQRSAERAATTPRTTARMVATRTEMKTAVDPDWVATYQPTHA
jgi:hypothetical protein